MFAEHREDLHRLVDVLPESELPKARSYLRFLYEVDADPLLQALTTTPDDDEPVSADEEEAVRAARAAIARGETTPWRAPGTASIVLASGPAGFPPHRQSVTTRRVSPQLP